MTEGFNIWAQLSDDEKKQIMEKLSPTAEPANKKKQRVVVR